MVRILSRLISLILIPCLLADPLSAVGSIHQPSPRSGPERSFSVQAMAGRNLFTNAFQYFHPSSTNVRAAIVLLAALLAVQCRSPDKEFEATRTAQDIAAIEKHVAATDLKSLRALGDAAETRQEALLKLITQAEKAHQKQIADESHTSLEEAKKDAAFDGFTAALSRLHEHALGKDERQIIGGLRTSVWKTELAEEEKIALRRGIDGWFAIRLDLLAQELKEEREFLALINNRIELFNQHAAWFFKGRMGKLLQSAREHVARFEKEEIQPGQELFNAYSVRMRSRIHKRLWERDVTYRSHYDMREALRIVDEGLLNKTIEALDKTDGYLKSALDYYETADSADTDSENKAVAIVAAAAKATAIAQAEKETEKAESSVPRLQTLAGALRQDATLVGVKLHTRVPVAEALREKPKGFWAQLATSNESIVKERRKQLAVLRTALDDLRAELQGRMHTEQKWMDQRIQERRDVEKKRAEQEDIPIEDPLHHVEAPAVKKSSLLFFSPWVAGITTRFRRTSRSPRRFLSAA